MCHRSTLFGLIFCIVFSSGKSLNSTGEDENCTDFGHITKVAHIGWPYQISCKDLLFKLWRQDIYSKDIECVVSSTNGTVLWNTTETFVALAYRSPDYLKIELKESENVTFQMKIKIKGTALCGKLKIHVRGEFSNARNDNCTTFARSIDHRLSIREIGNNIFMRCAVGYNDEVKISANEEDLSYEWWHNCSKKLPGNIVKRKQGQEIIVNNATFANGGEYICAVRYKDQLRFVSTQNLCLSQPSIRLLVMECPQKISGKKGEKLNITCDVDNGYGSPGFLPPRISWYNTTKSNDSVICMGFPDDLRVSEGTVTKNTRCIATQSNTTMNGKCYQYQPPPEENTWEKLTYQTTLSIRNFREWHVGEYTVKFTEGNSIISRTIKISMDESGYFRDLFVALGISAAALVVSIVVCTVCCCKRQKIKRMLKKISIDTRDENKSDEPA